MSQAKLLNEERNSKLKTIKRRKERDRQDQRQRQDVANDRWLSRLLGR
jgi:hypothetical protein